MNVIKLQGPNEELKGIYYAVDTESEPLGVGGMGQVFRGIRVHEKTGERTDVAIKFLFDDLPEHAIERARREASIQVHNENLVEMFGFIQIDEAASNGKVYEHYHVVSELLHGVMLFDLLNGKVTDKEGNSVDYAQELYQMYMDNRNAFALMVIKNMLSGIMALHDKGYVHRDLDPSNVMVTSNRKIKVIDFGIAKQLNSLNTQDRQLTNAGAFIGKASYAAPELVMGDVKNQNETTDIYALGIILYELVTGKLPFEGASHEVLDQQMRAKIPLEIIKHKGIRKIIDKATQKKQVDRYQSAAEFRVAIEQLEKEIIRKNLEGGTPHHDNSKPSLLEVLKVKKKALFIGAACVVIFVIGGIGWSVVQGNLEKAEQAQREEAIRIRIAELQDVVLDSSEKTFEIDSLTNYKIKTAGLITSEAHELLATGNSGNVKEGLELLDKVIGKKYVSSAEAMRLKSVLLYENASPFTPELQALKANVGSMLASDNRLAHELMRMAVELDSTNYKALYELGCDFYAGPQRTGVEGSRDIPQALNCFYRGLELAILKQDSTYMNMCKRRIGQLEE